MSKENNNFEDVYNFYQDYVFNKVSELAEDDHSIEFQADVACVALNSLPSKYIRHHVDMAFYLTPEEYNDMETRIHQAVIDAMVFVAEHERS